MLKFAFLGAWHSHAAMHVREVAARPDEVELVGMYDADPAVIQQNLERWAEYGLDIPVFDSVEDVLNSQAEAVIVEGHVYQNLDYAERALAAGKHVLLEKPAGVDLAQLERLHKLAENEGLMLQMAYMWRYNPAVAEMLRLVGSGSLGQVFMYRGHIPKPIGWHQQLYGEFTAYHGGVYFEMAGHLVDLMVAMMDEPVAVQGVLGKHYGERAEVDNAVSRPQVSRWHRHRRYDRHADRHGPADRGPRNPRDPAARAAWLQQAARLLGSGDRRVPSRRVAGRGTRSRTSPAELVAGASRVHSRRKDAGLCPRTRPRRAADLVQRLRHNRRPCPENLSVWLVLRLPRPAIPF